MARARINTPQLKNEGSRYIGRVFETFLKYRAIEL
jgi:hypothetical protein